MLGTYWKRIVEIADEFYQPGKFTTFAACEWTSTPNASNMHRNIFFPDSKKVPDMLRRPDWIKTAYGKGAITGGDLPAPTAKAPGFAVWASSSR